MIAHPAELIESDAITKTYTTAAMRLGNDCFQESRAREGLLPWHFKLGLGL
jgi:hypothetical protein